MTAAVLAAGALGAVMGAVLGDAALAAMIGGSFTVINTALTALLLRWVNGARRDLRTTNQTAAHAAVAAQSAAEGALEACRVAKAIGAAIRHDEPLIVRGQLPPEPPASS